MVFEGSPPTRMAQKLGGIGDLVAEEVKIAPKFNNGKKLTSSARNSVTWFAPAIPMLWIPLCPWLMEI